MAVDSVSSTNSAQGSDNTYVPGSERVPKKTLDQSDFFQLLAVQLSAQDPLKPMEDTDFIAQMASFSSLEMMNAMTTSVAALGIQQSYMNAQTLLGRTVTVSNDEGDPVTGVATAIKTGEDGGTLVTVGGTDYPASSVIRIELPADTTQPPAESTEPPSETEG